MTLIQWTVESMKVNLAVPTLFTWNMFHVLLHCYSEDRAWMLSGHHLWACFTIDGIRSTHLFLPRENIFSTVTISRAWRGMKERDTGWVQLCSLNLDWPRSPIFTTSLTANRIFSCVRSLCTMGGVWVEEWRPHTVSIQITSYFWQLSGHPDVISCEWSIILYRLIITL